MVGARLVQLTRFVMLYRRISTPKPVEYLLSSPVLLITIERIHDGVAGNWFFENT